MSAHKELTRHAFISHMEDYIKKLLKDPLHTDTDEFLKYHKIDGPKAISILTKKINPDDENSAMLIKRTKIKDNGYDEDGKRKPDTFVVSYKPTEKNLQRKLRNLYISLYESNIIEGTILNEEGECMGATNAASSGQYTTPLFGKPIKRTMHITSEQEEYIKKVLQEEVVTNTQFGDFGYDAPFGDGKKNKNNKFFADANDHKNIMKKSWTDENK